MLPFYIHGVTESEQNRLTESNKIVNDSLMNRYHIKIQILNHEPNSANIWSFNRMFVPSQSFKSNPDYGR
jgi:hypothetical protein